VAEQPSKRKQRSPRDRMMEGYAKAEQRNQKVREELEPLAEGERPTVVTVGAIVSGLIALSIIVGYLAGVKVDGERPEIPQVLAPALILGVMSYGMWKARYWAVLGFQLVLVLILFSSFLGLIATASSVTEFIGTTLVLVGAGIFFYFMVKAMARIQMPERRPPAR
jgi:hypothetical protein